VREGYGVSISIEYDTTDKKTGIKKSYWIRIGKVSPLSPPDDNYEKNQGKKGVDSPTESGGIISTIKKISPLSGNYLYHKTSNSRSI
jgi:hypothetical protein